LTKRFDEKIAVDGLTLAVPAGSFFGLVGPNGAGKTTTLRMATGLLRPDAGSVIVGGIDVWRDPVHVKARIGVVPEELRLFERLTGHELLTYNGLLRGIAPEIVEARATELLEVLGIADAGDTLVVDYSHGMKKKVALACALLHAPRVLFLDEPFEAIDPVSARTIRAVLERHVAAGATVVFSSHAMDLVERLCDRVAIIHQGRLVADGTVERVRGTGTLEDAFVRLVGGGEADVGALRWLDTSSD
jgi:ABC-2 type transport system ATP-binding protein